MKIPTRHSMGIRLERAVIAFFILAALSLLVVYLADPAIYAQLLSPTSSPADRYPVPVTLFLVGVLVLITLLSFGVVSHWRWLFWGFSLPLLAQSFRSQLKGCSSLAFSPIPILSGIACFEGESGSLNWALLSG
jgi:hypothetical protein